MKLIDLDPKLEGTLDKGTLRFNCPLGHAHCIRIPVVRTELGKPQSVRAWEVSGEFPDTLTVRPSIHAVEAEPHNWDTLMRDDPEAYRAARPCGWHGYITNGEIQTV